MSKFAPIPNPLSHKDENKIDFILRPCAKFKYRYKGISEKDQAILYLKLRSESCPKFEANLFAAKPTCKVDSTKTFDGPSKCRVLKVKGNSNLTVNVALKFSIYKKKNVTFTKKKLDFYFLLITIVLNCFHKKFKKKI